MARVIVKVGSSSLTGELGVVNTAMIENLCRQVDDGPRRRAPGRGGQLGGRGRRASPRSACSSGPTDLPTLQALAALGQPRMMETWIRSLAGHGAVAAQVLLVPHDFVNRRQYLHARQTLVRLLELGCVPVVNENDAIADDQIRFGDNDRLAALVAHLVSADVLRAPHRPRRALHRRPPAGRRRRAHRPRRRRRPHHGRHRRRDRLGAGSGGMASKLAAARIASWSGVRAVIARADRPDVVAEAVAAREPSAPRSRRRTAGCPPASCGSPSPARRPGTWSSTTAPVPRWWSRGTSLLPAGVVDVVGEFDEGDTLDVTGRDGVVFARGMAAADAARAAARPRAGARATSRPTSPTRPSTGTTWWCSRGLTGPDVRALASAPRGRRPTDGRRSEAEGGGRRRWTCGRGSAGGGRAAGVTPSLGSKEPCNSRRVVAS